MTMLPKWIPRPSSNGEYELTLKDAKMYNLDANVGNHLFINGHEFEVVGQDVNKPVFILKEVVPMSSIGE